MSCGGAREGNKFAWLKYNAPCASSADTHALRACCNALVETAVVCPNVAAVAAVAAAAPKVPPPTPAPTPADAAVTAATFATARWCDANLHDASCRRCAKFNDAILFDAVVVVAVVVDDDDGSYS